MPLELFAREIAPYTMPGIPVGPYAPVYYSQCIRAASPEAIHRLIAHGEMTTRQVFQFGFTFTKARLS